MSAPDKQKRKDEEVAESDAKAEDAAPKESGDAKGQGMKYVFKIAPADPKNNFDFEDVADK